jgi:hypothetical protein
LLLQHNEGLGIGIRRVLQNSGNADGVNVAAFWAGEALGGFPEALGAFSVFECDAKVLLLGVCGEWVSGAGLEARTRLGLPIWRLCGPEVDQDGVLCGC